MERTALSRAIGPLERDGLVTVGDGPERAHPQRRAHRAGEAKFKAAQAQWRKAQKEFENAFGADNAGLPAHNAAARDRGDVTPKGRSCYSPGHPPPARQPAR